MADPAIQIPDLPSPQPGKHFSGRRIWIARSIAVLADLLQIAVFPAFAQGMFSPIDDVLDVIVALLLILLLGWHILFIPTFIIEQLPIADLAPTWTIAVLIVTRKGSVPQLDSSARP